MGAFHVWGPHLKLLELDLVSYISNISVPWCLHKGVSMMCWDRDLVEEHGAFLTGIIRNCKLS